MFTETFPGVKRENNHRLFSQARRGSRLSAIPSGTDSPTKARREPSSNQRGRAHLQLRWLASSQGRVPNHDHGTRRAPIRENILFPCGFRTHPQMGCFCKPGRHRATEDYGDTGNHKQHDAMHQSCSLRGASDTETSLHKHAVDQSVLALLLEPTRSENRSA